MLVDLKGLANGLDQIREILECTGEVDHRGGILWTAADCLRQADKLDKRADALKAELQELALSYEGTGELLFEDGRFSCGHWVEDDPEICVTCKGNVWCDSCPVCCGCVGEEE